MQREKLADASRCAWLGPAPWWALALGPSRGIEAALAPPHCFRAPPTSVPVSRLRGGAPLVRAGRPPLRELALGGTPCFCRHASSLLLVFPEEPAELPPAKLVLACPEELLVEPPQAKSVRLASRAPSTAAGADGLTVLMRRSICARFPWCSSGVVVHAGGADHHPPHHRLIARGRSRILLPR